MILTFCLFIHSLFNFSNLEFQKGALDHLEDIKLEEWAPERVEWEIQNQGYEVSIPGEGYASQVVVVEPTNKFTKDNETFTITIDLQESSFDSLGVYRSDPYNLEMWEKVDHEKNGKSVDVAVQGGGAYVVRGAKSQVGLIVGIIVAVALVVLVVGGAIYFRSHPDSWSSVTSCANTGPV